MLGYNKVLVGSFGLRVNSSRFISNVCVIGSGLMGSGIAAASANANYNVHLLDHDNEQLKKSKDMVSKSLRKLRKGKSEDFVDSTLSKITLSTDLTALISKSDMIIETITEDLKQKVKLFNFIESIAPPTCVFATNTSSLSINELSERLSKKQMFAGLHFFNPVESMKLVEIIRGKHTSDDTVSTLITFAESLGKTVIECKDTPGFIVNRLLIPYLLEACEMWERGEASLESIDSAMRLGAGHPMGPFELADHVGIDTLVAAIQNWTDRYPEDKAFRTNATLKQLLAYGRFGKKCGHGFYKYDADGRIVKEEN